MTMSHGLPRLNLRGPETPALSIILLLYSPITPYYDEPRLELATLLVSSFQNISMS